MLIIKNILFNIITLRNFSYKKSTYLSRITDCGCYMVPTRAK